MMTSSSEKFNINNIFISQLHNLKGVDIFWSVCRRSAGREAAETAAAALCPGNKPCYHDTKEVSFLKSSCQDFLSSGVKYQHVSPPSPEIDYIPIRVELREQATRTLLEVM